MTKTLLITILLIGYLVVSGCKSRKQRTSNHLHNYPMYKDQDCPGVFTREGYDPHMIKLRASAVNMRPVDYLHKVNSKRWRQQTKDSHVGFTDD